ncbi:hypothetical protein ARC20_01410 [Stenotrophomonas panacihumi]|uniref:Uncharacterized protein n=1 Tax=Stenotrophomonas panacihumi TaxID=676599 RepID=A0A0R0A5T9_9GAMM|nr:hypothetical protein [Stenotrophomonas panacihumi]KRG40428.1 hypothetical protein ARC20_01410 [Stenotrophomonas panacihumi]PTN54380.1 hypothetical protein C9J98_11120 [Stenotrophomonas panacihumi]
MIRIPQHANGRLIDFNDLLAEVDRFLRVDHWRFQVSECLGDGADAIEERSWDGEVLGDAELRALYRGIYQTINGRFVGHQAGQPVCELEAVDSSFWTVSGPAGLEDRLRDLHGEWQPATR